ncbi:hypothetical protein MNBD_GAMMA01-166 [hydrothermal vent metagenome]|uniref:Uncharacterized protein n=1 Tax=hydrothermal vent metagenome TaxID=652676 RepID=A0A3B0VSQ4_9ZZZZ
MPVHDSGDYGDIIPPITTPDAPDDGTASIRPNFPEGCDSSTAERRLDAANVLFGLLRAVNGSPGALAAFMIEFSPTSLTGAVFTVVWRDGSTSTFHISGPMMSLPLAAELSCG